MRYSVKPHERNKVLDIQFVGFCWYNKDVIFVSIETDAERLKIIENSSIEDDGISMVVDDEYLDTYGGGYKPTRIEFIAETEAEMDFLRKLPAIFALNKEDGTDFMIATDNVHAPDSLIAMKEEKEN